MNLSKTKLIICFIWIFSVAGLIYFETLSPANGQTKNIEFGKSELPNTDSINLLISKFDKNIQQRFLTEPSFGGDRIGTVTSHISSQFSPLNEEEKTNVANFEKDGWKISLYLFGRRVLPKVVNGKEQKKFSIFYRLNNPFRITPNLKEKQLPEADKLLKEVKDAFLEFQTPKNSNESDYEFKVGKWSYVAKPVRAVESCLKCHSDYVITAKRENNQFDFRKRKAGDVNGILVYGFTKDK